MKSRIIKVDEVASSFSYNEETGEITRIKFRGLPSNIKTLKRASKSKYPMISFNGNSYLAHRIAWVLKTKKNPELDIDHINGDKWDNRWSNLRVATTSQNCQNKPIHTKSKSGVKGVCFHKLTGKWFAQIKINGKHVFRKLFNTIEEAEIEIKKQRLIYHKEFSNHGKLSVALNTNNLE